MHESHSSQDFGAEQLSIASSIFTTVESRFQEAVSLQQEIERYKHVLVNRDPQTMDLLAVFMLAESYEQFIKNEGELIEVAVPTQGEIDTFNPLSALSFDNPNRYVLLKRTIGNKTQVLKVTNYKIDEYGDTLTETTNFGTENTEKSPTDKIFDLVTKLQFYDIVPNRKYKPDSAPEEQSY